MTDDYVTHFDIGQTCGPLVAACGAAADGDHWTLGGEVTCHNCQGLLDQRPDDWLDPDEVDVTHLLAEHRRAVAEIEQLRGEVRVANQLLDIWARRDERRTRALEDR